MALAEDLASTLPQRIVQRLKELEQELEALVSNVEGRLETRMPGPVALRFQHAAIGDVLTQRERAQSINFVTRYEALPAQYSIQLTQRDGKWHLANMSLLRYILNDYRPLIQNKRDAVHYRNIHNTWHTFLQRSDPKDGLTIRALDTKDRDVTPIYAKWLGERNQAITEILASLQCDYLYNGILQHSAERFAEQFLKDYISGEINYLLWKHVHAFDIVREMLRPYHALLSILTFPKLGPL